MPRTVCVETATTSSRSGAASATGAAGRRLVTGARSLHAERHVLDQHALVRRVDVALGQRDAAEDRRDPLVDERRDDRQRPAGADEQRPPPEHLLERVLRELASPAASAGTSAAAAPTTSARPSTSAPAGAASRRSRSTSRRDLVRILSGRQADRDVRLRVHRQHRLLQLRRAALDPVHVDRRLGARCARRSRRAASRVRRPRALVAQHLRAASELAPAPELLVASAPTTPARSGSGRRPSSREHAPTAPASARASRSARRRRTCPECRSRSPVRTVTWKYTSPRVAIAELGHAALRHAAVEDQRRIGAALVVLEEVDDRVAADLLLAVAGDADVDRQRRRPARAPRPPSAGSRAGPCRRRPRARRATRPDGQLERRRVPQLERRRRLHVEVPVDEHGRRLGRLA